MEVHRVDVAESPPSAPLLVRASSAAEVVALEHATRGRTPVRFCASARELLARLQAGATAGVVLEVGPGTRREVSAIAAGLEGRAIPLLLRFGLRDSLGIRDVLELRHRVSIVRISSREVDNIADDIAAILTPALPAQPRLHILTRMEPLLSGPAMHILVAAVIAGRRAITVPELAALCDLSVRTVEVRCHEAGILGPKPLLGWMLALHATWWVSRFGWSLWRVAQTAGLASEAALARRVVRTTGLRPAGPRHMLDFEELLDRFDEVMVGRGGSSRADGITA